MYPVNDQALKPSSRAAEPRIPVSTYRLQLHPDFGFAQALDVVPYLAALGATDCYLSPPFTARVGSTHGYDVCNHNEINPELGAEAGFVELATNLAANGMGLILDFVPNHMGNEPRTNDWWRDVLENGPSSPYARFFDIDWDPVKLELKDRLLLPILGEQYGEALEGGKLRLQFESGALVLAYGDHRVPINPRRSPMVYALELDTLTAALGQDDPDLREFLSVLTALRNLPAYTERDAGPIAERTREKEVARERLARLVEASDPIRRYIEGVVTAYNGVVGKPESFDRLHELLELQAYRLVSWRTASDEINFRRFFDINELAGLRVEDPEVFDGIHQLILRLIGDRAVTGLRLDHIDGLSAPAAYLQRLRDEIARVLAGEGAPAAAGHAEPADAGHPFYVAVEKILSASETLPEDWAVAGTTGYAFLNDVNGVFINGRNAGSLGRTYVRLTGRSSSLSTVMYESKRLIISTALTSEFQVLANAVNRLSERDRRTRDFTFGSIRRALREVVACFPVYRTYVSPEGVSDADRAIVDAAIQAARSRNPATEPTIFEFLRAALLPFPEGTAADAGEPSAPDKHQLDVAMKFQQYTAPVQAKGIEDTSFYRHGVLLSLNEVGGDPQRFGRTVDAFHAANLHRRAHWPFEMNATATHDTKRGEDARARLNVLSEFPGEWRDAVVGWMRMHKGNRVLLMGEPAPDRGDEYHFYQALLAVWPAEADGVPVPQRAPAEVVARLREYMTKAIREAKIHTSWVNANDVYEEAVTLFVERTLTGSTAPHFLASFVPFARRVARLGMINSLAQLVLKLVSPGVPDFYQGTELWDLSLVDPDNRRPVDYSTRRALLVELEPALARVAIDSSVPGDGAVAGEVARMVEQWPDGRLKLFLTASGLRLRRARSDLFLAGEYTPVSTDGWREDQVVACARQHGSDLLVAVVPRFPASLTNSSVWSGGNEVWRDTRLRLHEASRGRVFRNLFTGEIIKPIRTSQETWIMATQVLGTCPVALLWGEST